MNQSPTRRAVTKKVRFNEKVQVYLIPSRYDLLEAQFVRNPSINWMPFTQIKPLFRKTSRSPSLQTLGDIHRERNPQTPGDFFGFLRNAETARSSLGSLELTLPSTPRIMARKNTLPAKHAHQRTLTSKEMTARGRRPGFQSSTPITKAATAGLSPLCRQIKMGDRGREEFHEILTIYGNNPLIKTKFSERGNSENTVTYTGGEASSPAVDIYFNRSPSMMRPTHSACSVIPRDRLKVNKEMTDTILL